MPQQTNVPIRLKYPTERVRGPEHNIECAKRPRKDQAESTEEVSTEIRHAAVPRRTWSEAEYEEKRKTKEDPPHRF